MNKTDADEVTQYELETWARCAEDYLDTFAGLTSKAIPLLLEAAEIRPGSHVLDLGSGPGHGAEMFAQAGAVVTGDRAKQQADEAAAKLGNAEPLKPEKLTLQRLFEMYLGERTPGKSAQVRAQDQCQADLFLRCFGGGREAKGLSVREWDLFKSERSSGRLAPKSRSGCPVGPRTVEKDLRWLVAVLNWATKVSDGREGYLLERNPLKGLPFPTEPNPRRPFLEEGEYSALLTVAPKVGWRFEVALILAHETGHRIGAIRRFRWSDIDIPRETVFWRKENDKIGMRHETPLTGPAMSAVRIAARENPGIGDSWLFPSLKDPSKPCSRHFMKALWLRGENLAGIVHRKGMGWHCLRRKFANDLQREPMKMLCALGGWKSS